MKNGKNCNYYQTIKECLRTYIFKRIVTNFQTSSRFLTLLLVSDKTRDF